MTRTRPIVPRLAAAVATAALISGLAVATSAAAIDDISTIAVGDDPAYVAFSPDGTRAYVTNRNSDTVSVINVIASQTIATVPVGDQPHGVAVSPDGSVVYVTNIGGGSVSVIDTATNTVVGSPIPTGSWAYDVTFTPDGTKALVTNYNDGTFAGFNGTVSIIDVASATVSETLSTPGFVEGVAVSPDGTFAYVTATGGTMYVIDIATESVIDDFPLPGFATAVVFSLDGLRAYTSNNANDTVSVIDVAAATVIDNLPISGNYPVDIDITPDGSTVYVAYGEGTVEGIQPIDVATNTVGARIEIGDGGTGISGLAISPVGDRIYVVDSYNDDVSVVSDLPLVNRLAGTSRYQTAIKISQAGFPTGADVVFVATGLDYPDALAAGPAAAELGGPVILTDPTTLPADVEAEIERLDPSQIYIVGGTGRVSAAIQTQLTAIAPTDRIAGSSRFETSRLIADLAFGTVTDAYVATGLNFPDALAAGAAGAVYGSPVILVDGAPSTVDQATLDLLTALGSPSVTVVGGTNWVSAGIESQLSATRIAGSSRYETALLINEAAYTGNTATHAIIATGVIFPDALSASAWAGRIDAPLYLSPGNCVAQGVIDHMEALGVLQVTLVGGVDRLNQSVFDLVPC